MVIFALMMQELMATLREGDKKEDKKEEDEEEEKEETEQQAPDWNIKTPGEVCVCVCSCVNAQYVNIFTGRGLVQKRSSVFEVCIIHCQKKSHFDKSGRCGHFIVTNCSH